MIRSCRLLLVVVLAAGLPFAGAFVHGAAGRALQPEFRLPYKYISGLRPIRTGKHTLLILQGAASANNARGVISFARNVAVDIRNTGLFGRDNVATLVDIRRYGDMLPYDPSRRNGYKAQYPPGHRWAGRPLEGWYHVVYLKSSRTGEQSVMLTRQITSMRNDRANDAQAPARFDLRRHSPVVFYYHPEKGFRPQQCYGWPQPVCVYTLAGTRPEFAALENFESTRWKRISLSKWIPDSGRIIRLQAVIYGADGTGSAWASTTKRGTGAIRLGYVNRVGDRDTMIFEIATDSLERIAIRTDPGVSVSLYAVGFAMAQPF